MMFDEEEPFKSLNFQTERAPFFNWKYMFRTIMWRFLEITSRICLLLLVWSSMGGVALLIVLAVDFVICFGYCVKERSVELMGMMMYISFGAKDDYVVYFWLYRIISFYILLILSTIF